MGRFGIFITMEYSVFRPAGADTTNQSPFRTLRKSIILILNNPLQSNWIAQCLHFITAKQNITVLWKLSQCQLQLLLWTLSLMRIRIECYFSGVFQSQSVLLPALSLNSTTGLPASPWGRRWPTGRRSRSTALRTTRLRGLVSPYGVIMAAGPRCLSASRPDVRQCQFLLRRGFIFVPCRSLVRNGHSNVKR